MRRSWENADTASQNENGTAENLLLSRDPESKLSLTLKIYHSVPYQICLVNVVHLHSQCPSSQPLSSKAMTNKLKVLLNYN